MALDRTRQIMERAQLQTRAGWSVAHKALLAREKEHSRLGDEIALQRRDLPWVRVDKEYRFDTEDGTKTLVELFDGRTQLAVYHFMFGPSYLAGDPPNSSIADAVNSILPHLHARDVTVLFVSQAPLEKLQAYKRRMGWNFPWVSAANTEFNIDLGFSERTVDWLTPEVRAVLPPIVARNAREAGTEVVHYLTESPGFSAFAVDDGSVYLTYTTTARGVEFLMSYYAVLDRMPKGRDEGDQWQMWLRRHDEYGTQPRTTIPNPRGEIDLSDY